MRTTRRSLLLRLRDRADEDAWVEFHALYAPLVRRVARRSGLDHADADDTVQDVLLALTGSMPEFEYDPHRGRFRGLLQTIAMRAILKKRRQKQHSRGKRSIEACEPPAVEPTDVWERAWRQHHLDLAMTHLESELRERDRLAFKRYAIEGRDAIETAREFDLSLDQLYQIKTRVLRRLGQRVEEQIRAESDDD